MRTNEDSFTGFTSEAVIAANASEDARVAFIQRTYLHLFAALAGLVGLLALFVPIIGPTAMQFLAGSPWGWLVVLGGFMLVTTAAQRMAHSEADMAMQYAGLLLYVVAEAVILSPLVYLGTQVPGALPMASAITLSAFAGLTVVSFMIKRDLSFMGRFLSMAGFGAMGFIVLSVFMPGMFASAAPYFAFAMVLLMGGYIVYQTNQIMRSYPVNGHVGAALGLFATVATLFWYVLRLVLSFTSND
jgi:FtsH-binding integral membrane protein